MHLHLYFNCKAHLHTHHTLVHTHTIIFFLLCEKEGGPRYLPLLQFFSRCLVVTGGQPTVIP